MLALLYKDATNNNSLRCVVDSYPIELIRQSFVDFDVAGDYKVIAVRGHKKHNIVTFTCDVFETVSQISTVNGYSVINELLANDTPSTFTLLTPNHTYSGFYLFDLKIAEIIPLKVVCSSVQIWSSISRAFPDYYCKCEVKLLNTS